MATYNKGILGAFSGKVGTVVGVNWRGRDIIRSLPKRTTRIPSENQFLQRQRFTAVAKFLRPLRGIISRYYGIASGDKSKINLASSYHMKEATVYVDGDFEILFNRVQISKGVLLGLQAPAVAAEAGGKLLLSWADNSGQGTAKGTDWLMVVVFDPASNEFVIAEELADRAKLTAEIVLQPYFVGSRVHCWAFFASEDAKLYSTSVYLGAIMVV